MADLSWPKVRKLLRAPNIGFNAEVYRHFKDDDDTTRKAVRDYCLIGTKDSRLTADSKIRYFREFIQKVHNKPAIIGLPKEHFDADIEVKYKPIVHLYFQQDRAAVSLDYAPITAEISFRLMNQTSDTISQTDIKNIARAIKNELAIGQGYTFNKGKIIAYYVDKERGYNLQIYVLNETEGIEVVKKILSIQNHTYDDDKFKTTQPKRNPVNTTTNTTIAGKSYKKSRWRPTGTVRFQWATLIVNTVPDPYYLVDRTLSRPSSIEIVY